jgi:hypothetical protein
MPPTALPDRLGHGAILLPSLVSNDTAEVTWLRAAQRMSCHDEVKAAPVVLHPCLVDASHAR